MLWSFFEGNQQFIKCIAANIESFLCGKPAGYKLTNQRCIKSSCQVQGHVLCAKHGFIPRGWCIKRRPESHFIDAKDIHCIASCTVIHGGYLWHTKQTYEDAQSWHGAQAKDLKMGAERGRTHQALKLSFHRLDDGYDAININIWNQLHLGHFQTRVPVDCPVGICGISGKIGMVISASTGTSALRCHPPKATLLEISGAH